MACSKLVILILTGLAVTSPIHSSTCPSACQCSTSLKSVDCSGRGLTTVPSSFPVAAEIIKLSRNKISSISTGAFQEVPNLEQLYLSGNKLGSIASEVFDGCPNLTNLVLSGNTLKALTLESLPKLQVLDVSQNHLTAIPTLGSIHQLEYLYLGNNLLTSLNFPQQFALATNLQRITLSNNDHVSSISKSDFESLSNSSRLSRLYLSRCGISQVEAGSFSPVAGNLASLSLSQNPIGNEALQNVLTDFHNEPRLMALVLSGNNLTGRITNATFSALGPGNRLSSLDLSASSYISGIDIHAFGPLPYLNTLIMTKTGINQLPYLKDHTRLTKLDLSQNFIGEIFDRLPPKLTELSLNSNRITAITGSPFSKLGGMMKLRLDNNLISTFTNNDLIGMPLLESLNMSHNELNYLPNDVFLVLGNITALDLSFNNIVYINNSVFRSMVHMTTIDISNNRIHSFIESLFDNMLNLTSIKLNHNNLGYGFADPHLDYTGLFAKLKKLKVVDLSFNEITTLPAAIVSGPTQLQTLSLADNNIHSWDGARVLKGSAGVKSLLLNNNKLSVLSSSSFTKIHNLSRLDLTSNPFDCNCDMREFRDWLNTTKIEVVGYHFYKCASPPALSGTWVIEYDLSQIQCLPVWIWIITGVGAGVILLLIIICILYRCRWKIGYQLHRCTRSCWCACCIGDDDYLPLHNDGKIIQFAAFLSHCDKEECEKLVRESILPSIDNNSEYPEHRGSYPIVHKNLAAVFGSAGSYYRGLETSLDTSAACIILICKHYKKNNKQMFECDMIQDHRKEIILVLTTDASAFKHTPKLLLPIIDGGNHIEWKRNEERSVQLLNGRLARVWDPSVAAAESVDRSEGGNDFDEAHLGAVPTSSPIQPYYSSSEVRPLSIQASADSQ